MIKHNSFQFKVYDKAAIITIICYRQKDEYSKQSNRFKSLEINSDKQVMLKLNIHIFNFKLN